MSVRASVALWVATVFVGALCAGGSAGGSQWREIPLKSQEKEYSGIRSFALAADGTPWAVFSKPEFSVCYFESDAWHPVSIEGSQREGEFAGGHLFHSRKGSVLYCALMPTLRTEGRPTKGRLVTLTRGRAASLTEYAYEDCDQAPLYCDRAGRIWNWTSETLAVCDDRRWTSFPEDFGKIPIDSGPFVIERGDGEIYFIMFGDAVTHIVYLRQGKPVAKTLPGPFVTAPIRPKYGYQLRPVALPWGGDKAVVLSTHTKKMACLDLARLEFVAPPFEAALPSGFDPHSALQDRDGNIFILGMEGCAGQPPKGPGCLKLEAAMGKLKAVAGLQGIAWDSGGHVELPRNALVTQSRNLFLATPCQGVALYKGGRLNFFGPSEGVTQTYIAYAAEGPDGRVWCASREGVLVYEPAGAAVSTAMDCEVCAIEGPALVRDNDFRLWTFLKEKPGCLSRFDGRKWKHYDLGFPSRQYLNLFVDNLNRVYAGSHMGTEGCARVDPDGRVQRYKGLREMLVSGVAEGAVGFRSSRAVVGPLVTPDKHIWYTFGHAAFMYHYNGQKWEDVAAAGEDEIENVFSRRENPVLAATHGRVFLRPENGKLVEFPLGKRGNEDLLIGEKGFETFEADTARRTASGLFPVRVFSQMEAMVFDSYNQMMDAPPASPGDGVKIAREALPLEAVRLSPFGGYWTVSGAYAGSGEIIRSWNGLHIRFSTRETPIRDRAVEDLCEDAAGNLWLYFGLDDFLIRLSRAQMETRIIRAPSGIVTEPKVRFEFEGTADGRLSRDVKFSWRLNQGRWSEPTDKTYAETEITSPGDYRFEVTAVGKYAAFDRTPASASFTVPRPQMETRITTPIAKLVTEPQVRVEFEGAVGGHPSPDIRFAWRLNGGPWSALQEKNYVDLDAAVAGQYVFEVAAQGPLGVRDSTPARAEFEVRTSFEQEATMDVKLFYSENYGVREKAVAICVRIGPRCLPLLKQALKDAPPDVAWWIRSAVEQIEAKRERP